VVEAKVIVIEPADLEANALQTLLRFLDLEPVTEGSLGNNWGTSFFGGACAGES